MGCCVTGGGGVLSNFLGAQLFAAQHPPLVLISGPPRWEGPEIKKWGVMTSPEWGVQGGPKIFSGGVQNSSGGHDPPLTMVAPPLGISSQIFFSTVLSSSLFCASFILGDICGQLHKILILKAVCFKFDIKRHFTLPITLC